MITGSDILDEMYHKVVGICDKTFTRERPASTSDELQSFIVCALPGRISNLEISDDGNYDLYKTIANFEVYVRDKTSSKNINQANESLLGKKVKAVKALFPMKLTSFTLTEPQELITVSDGKQFHCTIIQCDLETR